jgi:NADPH:quinone reductase-like Zn-dependent oxidoreductase
MMKAIRVHEFGDPEVLQLEEVAEPRPGPGQVGVKIKAIGINPLDAYIRLGTGIGQGVARASAAYGIQGVRKNCIDSLRGYI